MKILVADDEQLARQRLGRLIKRIRPEAELIEAANGIEALEQVGLAQPQIVLLDIRMPQMDGVQVAAALAQEPAPPAIIFCTAYDEYALDALKHQAIGYLLKPVRERELERALQSCTRVNRAQLDALGVAADGREEIVSAGHRGIDRLPVAAVRCFIADDKYVRACGPDGELLLTESLKDLETEFAGRFLRVHRNALVALAHVHRMRPDARGWVLELDSIDFQPQVSRRHLASLKLALTGRSGVGE
ncbi:MAG: LytR/AlgR family response regulator transcription factor [Congregibacter sp.]